MLRATSMFVIHVFPLTDARPMCVEVETGRVASSIHKRLREHIVVGDSGEKAVRHVVDALTAIDALLGVVVHKVVEHPRTHDLVRERDAVHSPCDGWVKRNRY